MANKTKILNQAQKFITKGQWDKAIRELQKLIAEDPKDVRTLLKLGDVYSKQGDRESATRVYRQVAESYGEQGFFLKAVAVYKQILKHDPQHLEVTVRLAELYEKLSLGSEAQAQYQNAVKLHEQRGETGKALQVLEKIVEMEGNNVAARIKLAEGFSRENMLAEAAAQFERAARTLKEQNRVDDYIKVAERLVFHDPSRVDVVKDVAKILLSKGETKRALAKLQVMYKENTKDIETLHLLARAFTDLGQSQKTIYVFRELARVHQEQGRPVEAATVYQQILQIDPNDPEARQALGYEQGGAPTAAVPSGPLSFGPGQTSAAGGAPLLRSAAPGGTPLAGAPVAPSAAPRPSGRPPPPPPPDPLGDEELVMSDAPPRPMAPRVAPRPPPPPRSAPPAPTPPPAVGPRSSAAAAPVTVPEKVQKILTETDVFIRYGLREKALEHLRSVFALDPDSIAAFEKMRDVHLGTGDREKAAEALGNIVQICTRRGDKESLDRYRRELAEIQPEHPLAAGALSGSGAAAGELESISIDIDDGSDRPQTFEPGDGADFELPLEDQVLEEEPDPFAGAVVDEPASLEPDPFAQQTGHEGPDFDVFGQAGASADVAPGFESDGLGSSDALPIPSGVFDALDAQASGDAASAGSSVLLLEDIEGTDEAWVTGAELSRELERGEVEPAGPATTPSSPSRDLDWAMPPAPSGLGSSRPGPPPPPPPDPDPTPFGSGPVVEADEIEIEAEVEDVDFSADGLSLSVGAAALPPEPEPDAASPPGFETEVTGPPALAEPPALPSDDVDEDVDDELDEVEFMLDTGLEDEAREMLKELFARAPRSERARALWARLSEGAEDAQPADDAGPPPDRNLGDGDMGPETRDVNAKVLDLLDADENAPPSEDRYDQGMMYRELGMYAEAIREFRAAARSERRALDSLEMIGHCLVAQGEAKAGIECFRLALTRGASGPAATNLKYEIGAAYEQIHDLDRAARWYRACAQDDPQHREVGVRLGAIERSSTNGAVNDGSSDASSSRAPQSTRKNKISYL